MISRMKNYAALATSYFRLNLSAMLEYRAAFWSQVVAMFINDGVWVLFWSIFFNRFKIVNGWTSTDVMTVWAVTAAGVGLSGALFGNASQIPKLVTQGQLDVWMLYPRSLLSHFILGRSSASAWGDVLFGYIVFFGLVHPNLERCLLFVLFTFSIMILTSAFSITVGSFAFFLGSASNLATALEFALISFFTYPSGLFQGAAKLLTFTLIPAAFVGALPVEAIRDLNLEKAALVLLGTLGFALLGVIVFYRGVKRYESGNLLEMRG
jgi:ABC-2 type transport system permease protein